MILIKNVTVKGNFDTEISVPDIKTLEEYRTQLSEAYGNGHKFEISFIIHTDNFENIKYPDQKKKK